MQSISELRPIPDNQMMANESVIVDDCVEEVRVRRPPNAFMLFGQKYRKVLAQKFTGYSNKQISKILGQQWKNMDPNVKNHYHSLAKEAYQTHLQKHPGYHYNPLVARQRKAERKRKYKTSRIPNKTRANNQPPFHLVKPFGGNCSISFPNTTFAFSQTPTVRYVKPVFNSGTGDSVIGIKRLNPLTVGQEVKPPIAPIQHIEHNYAFCPKVEPSFAQNVVFEANSETQIKDREVENLNQSPDNDTDWDQTIDFLVNFLPPMVNPNSEVTAIPQNYGQTLTEQTINPIVGTIKQESIDVFNQMMAENCGTDFSVVIRNGITDESFIKEEMDCYLGPKDFKVKTEPIDQLF